MTTSTPDKQNPAVSGPGVGAVNDARAGDAYSVHFSTIGPGEQTEVRNRARAAVQNLLAGNDPDGTDPATLGAWTEVYQGLVDAHDAGGTAAVRRVFDTLARANPALGFLVGTDPEAPKLWYSQADVYAMELPELVWIVPGLLHAGLTILSGQGKIGKSWLALQIAHAVATGGRVLDRQVAKRKVAYVAFEDGWRRIQERSAKQGIPADAGIFYADTDLVPLLNSTAGTEFVINAMADYDLLFLDTVGRGLDVRDRNNYAEMTGAVAPIQRAAQDLNKSVCGLDHHGKLTTLTKHGTPNPILDILGSVGLAGVVDCAIGMYKQHGETDLILATTGKEAEPVTEVIRWHATTLCWQLVGNAEEVARNKGEQSILDAIAEIADDLRLPTTQSIAEHLDKDNGYVSRMLQALTTAGKVVKHDRVGKSVPYLLPGMSIEKLG